MSILDWYQQEEPRPTPPKYPKALTNPITPHNQYNTPHQIQIQPIKTSGSFFDNFSAAQQQTQQFKANPNTFKSLPSSIRPRRAPRTRFYDPLTLLYATGFKDRRFGISYDTLRRVVTQLPLVAAIVNTRVHQVAAFSQPYREHKQIGYQVRFKDPHYIPTEEEKQALKRIEAFIGQCGWGPNPYTDYPREDFETFLRKFVRDSLTLDQACFEVVPDVKGRPYEFRVVDAATIRLAATFDGHRGNEPPKFQSNMFSERWLRQYGRDFTLEGKGIHTVQLLHGRIENIYTYWDMAFCIRNPRSNIWANGYGFAETEQSLNTILGMLWAEEYNRRFFKQGSAPKGILNIKGDSIDPDELEAFRRQWYAQIAGVENAWRTPIIQADGMEYQNLQTTNQEMEFQRWLEFLLRELTAVFLIDPTEINFDLGTGGQANPVFESKHEWKIKHSRDKGLRPLLQFVAKQITRYVIEPLDNRLYLDFVGLDELTEQDRIDLYVKRVSTIETLNEIRAEMGRPPLPGGDVVLNSIYIQSAEAAQQAEGGQGALGSKLAPWVMMRDKLGMKPGDAPGIPLYLQASDDFDNIGNASAGTGAALVSGGGVGGMGQTSNG